jgi:hypothetical protein
MSYNSPFTGNVIQPTDVSFRAITLSANTQLEWSLNGSVTGDYAARIMNVTPTASNLQLWMPPANQASVGQDALIRNMGASAFTVYDFEGVNSIVTVQPGQAQYIYITTNATESGTWGIIAFGIGSSGADATTLAGFGLLAVGATLNQSHPVVTRSGNYTILSSDRANVQTWVGGAGTFTLPSSSATGVGNNWFTMVRNSGTGTLALNTDGADFINGSLGITLNPGDSAFVVCSGTAYYTVGLGRNTQFNFTQLTKPVVSGTYVLTGAEASNVVQKYVGTLAGNVTVQVPPTIQVYYVQNACNPTVNNYSLTLTTGVAGSATAQIAANSQSILLCDSVNMLSAVTIVAGSQSIGLVDGTVTAPALYFANETGTGVYRPSLGTFAIAVLGVNELSLTSSGLTIQGSGTFIGGVSGGTF